MFGDGLEEPLKNFPVTHGATDPNTKAENDRALDTRYAGIRELYFVQIN